MDGTYPKVPVNGEGKFNKSGTVTNVIGQEVDCAFKGKFRRPKKAVGTFERSIARAATPTPRSSSPGPQSSRQRAAEGHALLTLGRMAFPATRLRRLRKTGVLRDMVRETELSAVAPRLPDVHPARDGQPYPDRGHARDRPTLDRPRRGRGGRGACARHPGGAPVRAARREGRARLRRLGRRGRRPTRNARDQGGPSGARRDHGPLPVRIHVAWALRRADAGRDRRQRRHARAARAHGRLAGGGRRRRDRAQRHDGRARRRAAAAARRGGLVRPADPRLLGQVRLRLLWPVPRGRRLGARVRRQARLPDGCRQRRRGRARGSARRRGGGGRRHGQAGAARIST